MIIKNNGFFSAKIKNYFFPFDMALLFWYIRADVLLTPKRVVPIKVAKLLFFRMVKESVRPWSKLIGRLVLS